MQFTTHKKRRAPTVIIISLIDVLMVVLIFLVVTTTFKQQPSLKLMLPESREAKPGASEDPPVLITINKEAPYIYLGGQAITYEQLESELKSRAAKNPAVAVAIHPSGQATLDQFTKVWDAVKAANIKSVNMHTAPPVSQPK